MTKLHPSTIIRAANIHPDIFAHDLCSKFGPQSSHATELLPTCHKRQKKVLELIVNQNKDKIAEWCGLK